MNKYDVRVRREVAEETTVSVWAEDEVQAMKEARENVSSKNKWEGVSTDPYYEVMDIDKVELGELLLPSLCQSGWERHHTGGGCMAVLWEIEPNGPHYLITDGDAGLDIYEREWTFGAYDAEGSYIWGLTSDEATGVKLTDFLKSLNLPKREPSDDASS
ncbi:hypothetical protein [Erythrobacter aureus]|uniref:Uncharacterized protein n=1 Tax=Erythrobacter aureus TaxID=2182384 RepID=A0A345YIQ0_9SPHN|nr:hypothetical protein [Erythrobacter aureus]AXK43802.1 hypothetical protein DVR09_15205 [Erythrobacter aureus]